MCGHRPELWRNATCKCRFGVTSKKRRKTLENTFWEGLKCPRVPSRRNPAYLALDDAVRDVHLAAEGGQPDHKLDGVHVVGDHHKRRLLLLDKRGHVLEAKLDDLRKKPGTK